MINFFKQYCKWFLKTLVNRFKYIFVMFLKNIVLIANDLNNRRLTRCLICFNKNNWAKCNYFKIIAINFNDSQRCDFCLIWLNCNEFWINLNKCCFMLLRRDLKFWNFDKFHNMIIEKIFKHVVMIWSLNRRYFSSIIVNFYESILFDVDNIYRNLFVIFCEIWNFEILINFIF